MGNESQQRRSIINYCLQSLVKDVKVVRGAEIDSDHHLVLMKMRVRDRKGLGQKGEKSVKLGFTCRSFTVWQDEYVFSAWCRPDVAESRTARMLTGHGEISERM